MQCVIYKGFRKPDCYLYVAEAVEVDSLPESLLKMLGQLELVMELDLASREALAYADINEVRNRLGGQGFYLQMPPGEGYPDL